MAKKPYGRSHHIHPNDLYTRRNLRWMTVKVGNGWVEVDTPYISKRCKINMGSARARIEKFQAGKISAEMLLATNQVLVNKESPYDPVRRYKRNGSVYTVFDVINKLPGVSPMKAHVRLRKWEAEEIDDEGLFKMGSDVENWGAMDVGPRKDISEIKITPFEWEYGKQVEINWGFRPPKEG